MKTVLTSFWLTVLTCPAFAQSVPDYYRAAAQYPDEPHLTRRSASARRTFLTQLVARYGEAYIKERWYVKMEGFFRSDRDQLSQTFNGLISTRATTQTGWSAVIGWVSNERWAIEVGYARSPIHNTLIVGDGVNALDLRFENHRNGFVVRGKRLMRFGKQTSKAGLWLGAGAGLIPNTGETVSRFLVEGYSYGTSYRQPGRSRIDTLSMSGETRESPRISGLVELSAEYLIKLGGRVDLSLFARQYWGIGHALTTNLVYRVNGGEPQAAVLRGNGRGWSVGVSVRYTYALRYDLRKMPSVFHLRGNRTEPASSTLR